ncbi:MAG: hypothetical protein ACC652_14465, partial [Acidimicrobiales bacterium]
MTAYLDPWDSVVADDRAVAQLKAASVRPVHAYLFVGPSGAGKRAAALAFAASVLSKSSRDPGRATRLGLAEEHPGLIVVEGGGASLSG